MSQCTRIANLADTDLQSSFESVTGEFVSDGHGVSWFSSSKSRVWAIPASNVRDNKREPCVCVWTATVEWSFRRQFAFSVIRPFCSRGAREVTARRWQRQQNVGQKYQWICGSEGVLDNPEKSGGARSNDRARCPQQCHGRRDGPGRKSAPAGRGGGSVRWSL